MIYLKRNIWIGICTIIIIILGISAGMLLYEMTDNQNENNNNNITETIEEENNNIVITNTIEIVNQEEKTTPNTLIVYRTYYTKCNHYINKYEDIDISAINLTKVEIQEKYREWNVGDFSSEQVILEKDKKSFCNEHFKLKLTDEKICIYIIDEKNNETLWKQTEITSEFLTEEDILKLEEGIIVYGKENLTSVLEDYE